MAMEPVRASSIWDFTPGVVLFRRESDLPFCVESDLRSCGESDLFCGEAYTNTMAARASGRRRAPHSRRAAVCPRGVSSKGQ